MEQRAERPSGPRHRGERDPGIACGPPGTSRPPVVIDGGDRSCVRLLLELREHVKRLEPETVVHVIATDPAAPLDLPAWCHLTGHAYLGPVAYGAGARPTYAIRIAAAARPTDRTNPWRREP